MDVEQMTDDVGMGDSEVNGLLQEDCMGTEETEDKLGIKKTNYICEHIKNKCRMLKFSFGLVVLNVSNKRFPLSSTYL